MTRTRRDFLKLLAFAGGLSGAILLSEPLEESLFRRLFRTRLPGGTGFHILKLAGGNDGYNTLIPRCRQYIDARPGIALTGLDIEPVWCLHPELAYLAALYRLGNVSFIRAVGSGSRCHEIAFRALEQALSSGKHSHEETIAGFDTHDEQALLHAGLLQKLDAYCRRLLEKDKTCLLVFSEMGRRLKENDYGGTDHCEEGLAFIALSKPLSGYLKGGVIGEFEVDESGRQFDFATVYDTVGLALCD